MLINIETIDSASMAEIHATIFSIIIGFISAYTLYIYSKINETKSQLLQAASKINTIPFYGVIYQQLDLQRIDFLNENSRKQILLKLRMLSMGSNSYYQQFLQKGEEPYQINLPTDPISQGREILSILGAIYSHYPIPISGNAIPFNDVNSVKKWVVDTEYVLGTLDWVLTGGNANRIENCFEALSDQLKLNISVEHYLRVIPPIRELLKSVNSQLAQISAEKPNKDITVIILIISSIGFLCGVIIPSINKNVDAIIFMGIPYLCYFIIFFFFLNFVVENIDSTK